MANKSGEDQAAGGLFGFIRRRIFVKYILATLIIGGSLNAVVLYFYYEHRRAAQTGQVAAEVATIANRIAQPAAELVRAGNVRQARGLLAVFSGFPYAICADLRIAAGSAPAAAWPVIGCDRINKPGLDIEVPLPGAAPGASILVRTDTAVLAKELWTEVGIVVALGLMGGLALILAGGFAFLWLINRPLSQLLRAIEQFERNDDPLHVSYRAEDEIGRVVASYNMMLDREVERVGEIREAHREIVDSVTYATQIQQGLLPTPAQCAAAFEDYAVIWQPRDLVGGDIYWIRTSGSVTTLAVIDCTGHGVPGGFMTMLAIATLERIFAEDESLTPGPALSRLSDLTRLLLNQDTSEAASNDGMDVAICQIDASTGEAVFAGARQSLLVVNGDRVERIRGDRMSAGYPDTPPRPNFTEHKLSLGEKATALVATDGLIDQLGGPKRRAFGYQRAMAELEAHATADPKDLLAALQKSLEDYSAGELRLDDLTVVAFRPKRLGRRP